MKDESREDVCATAKASMGTASRRVSRAAGWFVNRARASLADRALMRWAKRRPRRPWFLLRSDDPPASAARPIHAEEEEVFEASFCFLGGKYWAPAPCGGGLPFSAKYWGVAEVRDLVGDLERAAR